MPTFEVLCLAMSNKMRGSCVAGLRLDGGGWIRPVAPTPHGELYPAHYILQNGSCPRPFDVIRIPFMEPKPSPHQPENWMIEDRAWELISRGQSARFAALLKPHLIEGPALLGNYSHRISFAHLESQPAASSLCLIRPSNLRWKIEDRPDKPAKVLAQFRLGGTSYRLSVTDPEWLPVLRSLPAGEHPAEAGGITAEASVLLTISLGEPWEDGCCYKLVAAILPMVSDEFAAPPLPSPPVKATAPVYLPMDPVEAARIIGALSRGIDPHTNKPLPRGNPLSHPDSVKALRAAEEALLGSPSRKLSAQAGAAWNDEEEETLVREFNAGETVADIARVHFRTPGAIKARLVRLGMIE